MGEVIFQPKKSRSRTRRTELKYSENIINLVSGAQSERESVHLLAYEPIHSIVVPLGVSNIVDAVSREQRKCKSHRNHSHIHAPCLSRDLT